MVHDLGARDNKGADLTATFETALAATARRTAVDNQGIAQRTDRARPVASTVRRVSRPPLEPLTHAASQ